MTLDNEQIVRQAYKIAENKDLEGWVAASRPEHRSVDDSSDLLRFRASSRASALSVLPNTEPRTPRHH